LELLQFLFEREIFNKFETFLDRDMKIIKLKTLF
jgi:hypothetical protein